MTDGPVRLCIFLEAGASGDSNYLRHSMPLDIPMPDARLLVLRLIEQVQQAQEATDHAATEPNAEPLPVPGWGKLR